MEFNQAVRIEPGLIISKDAQLQAAAYLDAQPIRFSTNTKCCGIVRENSGLIDPGYYLNGGPSCGQLGTRCTTPSKEAVEAFADSLVPGSIVLVRREAGLFWPAIIDFCPVDCSHFVVFRTGDKLCCTPYAYYVTFISHSFTELYGGWYTTDYILPLDTAVNTAVDFGIRLTSEALVEARRDADNYYLQDLKTRLKRFSVVCNAVTLKEEKVSFLRSPGKAIREAASRAQKFSAEIARRLDFGRASTLRERLPDEENEILSLLSPSESPSDPSGKGFPKSTTERLSLKTNTDNPFGVFGSVRLADLAKGRDHLHPAQEHSPQPGTSDGRVRAGQPRSNPDTFVFQNPTQHSRCALNEVYHRSAILAVLRSGLKEIKTFRPIEENSTF